MTVCCCAAAAGEAVLTVPNLSNQAIINQPISIDPAQTTRKVACAVRSVHVLITAGLPFDACAAAA
jgi:aminoglycoside phosphotransferase